MHPASFRLPCLLLAGLLWTIAARASAPVPLTEPRPLSSAVMQRLADAHFADAFGLLRPHWPLPDRELDSVIRATEAGWPGVLLRLGKPGPIEFAAEQRPAPGLVRHVYAQRFSRGRAEWHLTFVQSGVTWRVDGVSFHELPAIAPE